MSRSADDRLIPSVLDRLIDLEPHLSREPPPSRTQMLREMKLSVGRDVQNLLNTRCRATGWPEELVQLKKSLLAYGIPDCVGINTGSREQQEKLRRMIEEAITSFEPRLTNVRVKVAMETDPVNRTLAFRVNALLKVDPAPEPVAYDSRLDATSGDFVVAGVRQ